MRIILLSIAFLFFAFSAQSQVLKSAGVWYFLDVDSMTARPAVLPNGTELAYVVGTKTVYYWNRNTSTWTAYGSTFNRDSIYFDSSIVGSGTVSDPWGVDSTLFATIQAVGDSIIANKQTLSFASPLLGISDGNNVDLSPLLSGYVTGSGTADYIPKWSAITNLTDSNIQDDGTAVSILSSKPFLLGQWTTAGRPSGTNGYAGFNTSFNWPEWYSSSAWIASAQSGMSGGVYTPGIIPYADISGRLFQNASNLLYNNTTGRVKIGASPAAGHGLDIGSNPTAISASVTIQINASGRAFLLANSATEYTDFVSGGVEKGMRGTGSVPFVLSNTGDIFFRTAGTERGRFTSGGLFGIGVSNPSYFLELNSTGAMGLTRGTTAQRPSVVTAKTPFRYNTDSTDVEFGESSGVWRMLADREYVRSFVRTGANPSASIGLSAVNGSAITYMRSDAAPALSQAIRPTWTDRHRFADTTWMDKNLEMDYASKIRLGGTSGDYSYGVRGDNLNGNLTTIMHSFSQVAIGFTPDNAATFNYPFFFDGNGRARFNADSTNDMSTTLMNGGAILVGYDTTEAPEMKSLVVAGQIGQGTLHPSQELDISGDGYIRDSLRVGTRPIMTSNQLAVYDANGWLGTREQKRDTTIYIDDADYDFSAAITTAQIASRFNRVIFWMTTTAAAGSDSELTLHTPDANLLQVEYLIHSVDEPAGFDNKIVFGSNNAVDSTNGLVSSYFPAAGQGVGIRAGLRSSVYKYRYY